MEIGVWPDTAGCSGGDERSCLKLLEEGEVDAAVGAVGYEVGMLGEVLGLAVLEDEEAAGAEEG